VHMGVWVHDLETDRIYAFDWRDPTDIKFLVGRKARGFRLALRRHVIAALSIKPAHEQD